MKMKITQLYLGNTLGTLPRGIMFTLLRGIWENYSQKPSVNILIVGLNNAGKTVNFSCALPGGCLFFRLYWSKLKFF